MQGPSRGPDTATGMSHRAPLMSSIMNLPVRPGATVARPTPEELRSLTERMPNCLRTAYGNVNVQTRVVARSKASTFVVSDDQALHRGHPMIAPDEGARMARLQDDYIRGCEMIVVDGYIGNDPTLRTATRLVIEASNANIAAMQRILFYPLDEADEARFEPALT